MKLDIYTKLTLEFMGEGWENCELVFTPILIKEAKDLMGIENQDDSTAIATGLELMKNKFVSGKVLSGGEIVDIKKNELEELPVFVIEKIMNLLVSSISKKK